MRLIFRDRIQFMKVFIENEAGSTKKNIFNEKTLEYKKTYNVSAPYPFPYGFILETTSGDGDNIDCFVLTNQQLKSREMVEVEPIGMFEQIENKQEDHKIIAVLPGKNWEINEEIQTKLKHFIEQVFSHLPDHSISVGRFLGKDDALRLIEKSRK